MSAKKNTLESQELSENIINTVREPLIVLDQDLRVVTASRSFYEFFKVKPEETEGKLIYNLGNKQWDIPKLRELLEDILPQKTTFDNYEVAHDFTTIGKRIMLLNARQIKRALGKEHIILLAIEDVTERRLSEEKLLLAAIVESSKDAIIGKSIDGVITSWNKGAEEIYGYTKSEIIGKSISVLIPPELPDEMTEMLRKIKLGESIENYETVRQRKDGQNIYVSLTLSAVYDAEGRILGASTIARDITERKLADEKLHEITERLHLATVSAKAGIWDWNLQTNEMKWDDRMLELYGLTRENFPGGIKAWEQGLHPDDSSRAIEECRAALSGERDFDTEFRVLHPDGVIVHIKANGIVLCDEKGKAFRMIGLNIDITERKQAEEQLQRTLESLRKSFGAIIQVMVSAVEMRDPYTSGHQLRVANIASAIATEMGLPQDKIEGIRMAGSIHDIGKLSIPAEILSKPTKLTNIEFSLIKEHPRIGYEMLKDVESPWPLAQIVYQHHERMDGSGYPRNLKGDEILMEARIMAVADVVEAMASHRPYRAALGIEAALEEIKKNKGIFYDNAVADACLRLFREKGYQII